MLRILAFVAIGALGALGALPAFPQEYSAVILFKMPYVPIEMPLRVLTWASYQKIEYYDGLQVALSSADGTYTYAYNNSNRVCMFSEPASGPTSLSAGAFEASAFLPDLSQYKQEDDELIGGIMCNKFSYFKAHGSKHTMDDHFSFYWDPVLQKPVRWHQHGRMIPFSSHTDEYVMDYLHFQEGTPPATDLALPELCKDTPTKAHSSSGLRSFLKAAQAPSDLAAKAKNMLLVDRLNQKHAGVATFKANQFMDLTKEEIMSFRGGKNKGSSRNRRTAEHKKLVRTHETVGALDPPMDFDWRLERPGAISPVKDQGMCGSCWTYGSIEPIESAVAIQSKNNLVVLPEQFMLDCTWTNNTDGGTNSGCDGGNSDIGALEIVRKYGGIIPTATAYGSYLSVNGYCKDITNMEVGAKITGWVDVAPRDDNGLMQALMTHGPISVAIQVPDDMLYYDTGVLTSTECKFNEDQIDHLVTLDGFGTQPGILGKPDQDYWLIRNSWSTYWGDRGYIKIARGDLDCCISCDAGYPEIAPASSSSVIV